MLWPNTAAQVQEKMQPTVKGSLRPSTMVEGQLASGVSQTQRRLRFNSPLLYVAKLHSVTIMKLKHIKLTRKQQTLPLLSFI